MKKTPAALKWLAERRARVAHDYEQTSRIAAELAERAKGLEADLIALDHSIRLYDKRINASAIQPVNGWAGTYGKRGGLRQTVLAILEERSPEWVLTGNIEALVRNKFGLTFVTPFERKRWYQNGFRATLKKLVEDGLIERENDPLVHTGRSTRWRAKVSRKETLDALAASVKEAADSAASEG
ncbi:MAG: hypothetical protein KGZ46_06215 [Hydrogenophaga sp.]|nr:hypothetical protein [Hydrogenophaga sp.]